MLGCEINFNFLLESLKKELEDHFKVGPKWSSYMGSWGDVKACVRDLYAMVVDYQSHLTKGGHWASDLTMIIENFSIIKKHLEGPMAKALVDLQLAVANVYRHWPQPQVQALATAVLATASNPGSGTRQLPLVLCQVPFYFVLLLSYALGSRAVCLRPPGEVH